MHLFICLDMCWFKFVKIMSPKLLGLIRKRTFFIYPDVWELQKIKLPNTVCWRETGRMVCYLLLADFSLTFCAKSKQWRHFASLWSRDQHVGGPPFYKFEKFARFVFSRNFAPKFKQILEPFRFSGKRDQHVSGLSINTWNFRLYGILMIFRAKIQADFGAFFVP